MEYIPLDQILEEIEEMENPIMVEIDDDYILRKAD